MRSRVRVLLLSLSRRLRLCRKKFSSPPTSLCHESRDFLYVYDLVYSLGEFLAPPLLKITFCILSCRERSWHWPVKASGRIRSWNVEESSMKVSVLFGRSQGNNTTLMLKLRVGKKTRNMCSPLSERMGEMRRHVTETMITASSMRANVVFMTA